MAAEDPPQLAHLYERIKRIRADKVKQPGVAELDDDAVELRTDSMSALVTRQPMEKLENVWRYYSLNSAKMRRQRLNELAERYERVRAASLDFLRFIESPGIESTEASISHSSSTGFLSFQSLPRNHPFAGTHSVEERKQYWNSLPLYTSDSVVASSKCLVENAFWTRSESNNRRSPSTNDDQAAVSPQLTEIQQQKPIAASKPSVLKTLCCRPDTVTPTYTPRTSRLPVRAATTLPARFKLRTSWGKKHRALDFDTLQHQRNNTLEAATDGLSSAPAAKGKRLLMPQHQSGMPTRTDSSGNDRLLGPVPLSSMIRRAPNSARSSPPSSTRDTEDIQSTSTSSLGDRLRNTTLADLPLGRTMAEQIANLLLAVACDRGNPYNTLPEQQLGHARLSEEDEEPLRATPCEPRAETVLRVRERLNQLDEEAAQQGSQEVDLRAQRRALMSMLTSSRNSLTCQWRASPETPTRRPQTRRRGLHRVPQSINGNGLYAPISSSSLRHVRSAESLSDTESQAGDARAEMEILEHISNENCEQYDSPFESRESRQPSNSVRDV